MGNVQNKGLKKTTQVIPKSWVVLLNGDFYEQVYEERHYFTNLRKYIQGRPIRGTSIKLQGSEREGDKLFSEIYPFRAECSTSGGES
uniref:Uncharacterized protein n=1 Tax=Strigops habroptila TaxID=2489341 RepID=A0A672TR60_STRHB